MNKTSFNPRLIIAGLFNFLVLSLPLYMRFVNEELFEFNKIILVYALTTLIVFFWLIRMVQEKRFILKKTPLDIPIFLFISSQVVSTIFSIHPRTSMLGYYSRFNGGLVSTISYVLLYYSFVSNIKKKDLTGILISTFLSGILVSIYGILEHFGHSISCLFAPGEKSFGVDCWRQDVQSRVFATFGQPNWLAAYAITILPLSGIMAIQKKQRASHKLFFAISSILLFAVLIFTRSRSGLLGFATGAIILLIGALLIFVKNKKSLLSKVDFKFMGGITLALFLVFGFFGTVLTPSFKELASKKNSNKINVDEAIEVSPLVNRLEIGGTDSGEIRKIVWKGGLDVWKRYPLIGSGVETFAYSYYLDRPAEHNGVSEWDFLYNKAHNELINFMATTGLFGLLTYLSIFAVFGILVLKTMLSKEDEDIKLISIAILAGITGLFVSNFFGFSTVAVNVLMFILFGIFIILNYVNNDLQQEEKYKIDSSDQYLSITLLSIFALIMLIKTYNYWDADRLFARGKAYFASGNLILGVQEQVKAIKKSPKEALYYDNLSDDYANLAVELVKTGQATVAASIINEAVKASDLAIKNNDRHLSFYKTRSKMFVTLAQLDERFLANAQDTLDKAMALSPTDPKLIYTQAVIELSNGNNELGQELLEKTLELKPNYEKTRLKLATIYESKNEINKAIKQLQYVIDYISPENQAAKDKILELKML